jgi:hypothetical protein
MANHLNPRLSKTLTFLGISIIFSSLPFSPLSARNRLTDLDSQTSSSSSRQKPPSSPDEGWHFALSPYLWFAGAHGTVGSLGRDASIHPSPGDLLSHFDLGVMGAAEARYNRFLLNGDMIWIRLSDNAAVPFTRLGATSADVRVGEFVWTSKVGYRLIDRQGIKTDANVGVRYWHLGQSLNFNPSVLGVNFNGSQSWADVLIGGRVQLPVGESATINLLGDLGGWNATAKFDYQFATLLGFKISPKWTLQAGYRYLFVDYRNGVRGVYNMVTSGAVFGATWNIR